MTAKTAVILGLSYNFVMAGREIAARVKARDRALNLVVSKGIINLGCGCNRSSFARETCCLPEVVLNVDLSQTGPKHETVDLDIPLPFSDKQFDVAFASHCLEHLENWEQALDEWTRIADHVIIALPNPLWFPWLLQPDHKQHFTPADIEYIRRTWAAEVYY